MNIAPNKLIERALGKLRPLLPGRGRRLCIGLEMGPDRLNLVQMQWIEGKLAVRAAASLPYPRSREAVLLAPDELRALLKLAFARHPFQGRRVVSCLPADQVKIITVSYRPADDKPAAEPIVAELRERLKGELDNMVVDFMVLREEDMDSGKRHALVALAPRERVLSYLDSLTDAGLQVNALDIGPAALARLVSHAGARRYGEFPTTPNSLVINFAKDASYLTVVWGRRVMLDRAIDFCENRLLKRLETVLDMSRELAMAMLYPQDASGVRQGGVEDETRRMVDEVLGPELALLQQEIGKTLVYMASLTRGKSVDVIWLTGRAARYPGTADSIRQQSKVPVYLLNPLAEFATEGERHDDGGLGTMAGIALTTGLALRGIAEDA